MPDKMFSSQYVYVVSLESINSKINENMMSFALLLGEGEWDHEVHLNAYFKTF